jgi:hypothetical protein
MDGWKVFMEIIEPEKSENSKIIQSFWPLYLYKSLGEGPRTYLNLTQNKEVNIVS